MERYVSGQSIRSIALAENRDRGTVAEILRSPEVQAIVAEQRKRVFALLPLAVQALEINLKAGEDGGLARNVLLDTGVLPRPKELEALLFAGPDIRSRALALLDLVMPTPPNGASAEGTGKKSTPATDGNDATKGKAAADGRNRGGPNMP